ncbi:hypothetical protein Tco_1231633, partial [Tanacetum coccineum]
MLHLLSLKSSNLGTGFLKFHLFKRSRGSSSKISLGRKKSQGSNSGDDGNTRGGGKTVGGALGARGDGI